MLLPRHSACLPSSASKEQRKNAGGSIIRSNAGIYIHIPFCVRKCSYCDFYSVPQVPGHYLDLICRELSLYQEEIKKYKWVTLYIGGGTPSLLDLKKLQKLFDCFHQNGILTNAREITIEANPDSFDEEKAKAYLSFGINRVSLGIQSFDDTILKKLGRLSDSQENIRALAIAAKYFKNYSADLIYGIPGQKLEKELQTYLSFNLPHLSAYCLTLAEGTPLYRKKKEFSLSDLELNRQFYQIHEFLEKSHYNHYEISNYAKKGFKSLHNKGYWEGRKYLGLGAGASGYLNQERYTNDSLEQYAIKVSQGIKPILETERLTPKNLFLEKWLLGLRLKEGFELSKQELFPEINRLIQDFKKKQWLELTELKNFRIKPTLKGWTMLDSILKAVSEVLL